MVFLLFKYVELLGVSSGGSMKAFVINSIVGFIFLLLFLVLFFSFKPQQTSVTVINNESCCQCHSVSLGDYDEH